MAIPRDQQNLSDEQLEWIVLRKELNDGHRREETQKEKLIRKVKDNPMVPIGKINFNIIINLTKLC